MGTIGIDYGVTKCASDSFLARLVERAFRSEINGQEIKINIFDMAGHPLFYEVIQCTRSVRFQGIFR